MYNTLSKLSKTIINVYNAQLIVKFVLTKQLAQLAWIPLNYIILIKPVILNVQVKLLH